jgi:hypothetical protein
MHVPNRVGLSRSSSIGAVTGRRTDGDDESAGSGVASGCFRKMWRYVIYGLYFDSPFNGIDC